MPANVYAGAERFVPQGAGLQELATAAAECEGCDLFRAATQVVFGDGPGIARMVLVGEQPGDVEDRRGEPFVGPAGRLLDRALADASIERSQVYLTNAVKHFRFKSTDTGKRRIHRRPSVGHMTACRPWLSAELADIEPAVLVALGAVAAQSLFGSEFRVTQQRGQVLQWPPPEGPYAGSTIGIASAIATIHPSAVLRGSSQDRATMYDGLVADLRTAAVAAGGKVRARPAGHP